MKRLFIFLTCLLSLVGGMKAEELTVYDGTTTNRYVPIEGEWVDSYLKCEFVMPGDELSVMAGGVINAINFYFDNRGGKSWGDAHFQVFVKEVDDATITDFYGTDGATIVYEGPIDCIQNPMTINFTTPYTYRGDHLLIGIYKYTESEDYSDCFFYGEKVSWSSVQGNGRNSFSEIEATQCNFLPKTNFDYTPGGATSFPRPSCLMVSDVTTESAVLSWTSDATAWQICLNGDEEHPIDVNTNPYTLTNLQSGTLYAMKARANYGAGNYSCWTSTVKFFTAHCNPENQQVISYVLTDLYGRGWGSSYINVVHHNTGIIVAKLTMENHGLSFYKTKEEGTLNLCCGETYDFFWMTSGNNDALSCYAFYDMDGEEIISFESDGNNGPPAGLLGTYTVDNSVTAWRKPTFLEATSIYGREAVLEWTENGPATAWVVAYKVAGDTDFTEVIANSKPFTLTGLNPSTQYKVKVRPATNDGTIKWSKELTLTTDITNAVPKNFIISKVGPHSAVINWDTTASEVELQYARSPWCYYDNGTFNVSICSTDDYIWGVKFPAGSYEGNTLTKVSVYDHAQHVNETCTIIICNGGDTAPSNPIATSSVTLTNSRKWVDVSFDNIAINNSKNVWIILSCQGSGYPAYPAASCEYINSNPNGRWICDNGTWKDMAEISSSYTNLAWMIRAQIATDGDPSSRNWVTMSDASSHCTLSGLNTECAYDVRLRGLYTDANEVSEWVTKSFRTLNENPAPYNLEAVPSTHSAVISWTGFSGSYKVRYRMKSYIDVGTSGLSDGFENGLGKWTVVRNGEGNKYTDWHQFTPSDYYLTYYDTNNEDFCNYTSHSGNHVAMSQSIFEDVYTPILNIDNWLISPQIALNDMLTYWVSDDGYAHDKYEVYVSTTTNDISSFVKVYEPGQPSFAWTKHAVNLKDYNGAMGYIAFRHTNVNGGFLLLDDVMVGKYVSSGQWMEVTTTGTSLRVGGLNSDTPYEYQIVGIKDGYQDAESEIATFTTLAADNLPEIALYANQDNSAPLTANDGKTANVTINNFTLCADGTWYTLCLPFSMPAGHFDVTPLAGYTVKELDINGYHPTPGIDLNRYDDYSGFDYWSANLYLYLKDADGIEAGKPYFIRKSVEEQELYNVTYTPTAGSAAFGTSNKDYRALVDGNNGSYGDSWVSFISNKTNGVWFCEFHVNTPVNVTGYVLTASSTIVQDLYATRKNGR